MSLSITEKVGIIDKFGQSDRDTGSVEVQIALLTASINKLTEHFKTHSKDIHSRRGLIRQVNQRRSLLQYLKNKNMQRYLEIIKQLNLRG
jgi:small subunit ribosomal protein S15